MDVETAETLMSIGKAMAITGFGFILYFLLRRPVEDDANERMDPMEPPTTEPIEDAKWLADIDAISSGDEAATAEPSETTELLVPLMRERRAILAPHTKRGRWERPEIKEGNGRWYSVFSPPRARGEGSFVGRGVVISYGSSRATIQLEDGRKTRRRVRNLIPTRPPPGPR